MLYREILRPLLFKLPPETAHEIAIHSLSLGLGLKSARRIAAKRLERGPFGELERFGLKFKNPVGLAAGFDKNGVVASGLCALGFGFVEVGTVTHLPQPGNERPRLFRLPEDRALINRLGFNNDGAEAVAARLSKQSTDCVLGINIGKSRAVAIEDATADYLASFELLHSCADYVTINVSSPNTPALRELQRPDALRELLSALQKRNQEIALKSGHAVPLLVKIAPDLTEPELEALVDVALSTNVSGIIATNTTIARDGLRTPKRIVEACGAGGLSGAPLKKRSTEMLAALFRLTRARLPLVGVGGIFTPQDAWEKISAGASLLQVYTGFIYEGLSFARDINEGLAEILARQGFRTLDEAVGCRLR